MDDLSLHVQFDHSRRARRGRDHDSVSKQPDGATGYERFRNDPRDLEEVGGRPSGMARGALVRRATTLPIVFLCDDPDRPDRVAIMIRF